MQTLVQKTYIWGHLGAALKILSNRHFLCLKIATSGYSPEDAGRECLQRVLAFARL